MNRKRKPKNPNTEIMTEISSRQWDFITQENLTAKEAAEYLLNEMRPRTFQDHLKACYDGSDTEKLLANGMYQCALSAEVPEKSVKYDSIRRKVHNWMNNKNVPVSREEIFQICFSLNLNELHSDHLLKGLAGQGIHYRDSREIIYAYCLKFGYSYKNALELTSEFKHKADTHNRSLDPVTQLFKNKLRNIYSKDELITFLLDRTQNLGIYNNTAYEYFCKMLFLVSKNDLSDHDFSMKSVADLYLRMNMPLDKRTAHYTDIQKTLKKYWPSSRSIKAMKSRREDVTRKVLLLLYLVTDGSWDKEYNELDESYLNAVDFLEMHCKRMNHMLIQCGMGKIDPRNVFDYLILFSLRPEIELSISERMSKVIEEIFSR